MRSLVLISLLSNVAVRTAASILERLHCSCYLPALFVREGTESLRGPGQLCFAGDSLAPRDLSPDARAGNGRHGEQPHEAELF